MQSLALCVEICLIVIHIRRDDGCELLNTFQNFSHRAAIFVIFETRETRPGLSLNKPGISSGTGFQEQLKIIFYFDFYLYFSTLEINYA